MNNTLSLLTYPSYSRSYRIYKSVKEISRQTLGKQPNNYFGHSAVNRSLCKGLKELNVSYNFNPLSFDELGKHVHVLAGLDTVKLAVRLKQKSKINTLTAGPNIVISSADSGGIVANEAIDKYLVNSEWVKEAYMRDNEGLKNKIGCWPSGVDIEYWNVVKKKNFNKRLLFYIKTTDPLLVEECKLIADKYGFICTMIYYGNYVYEELKQKLMESDFVIYFQDHESQGIALFEIWASGTPTFVWDPGYWMYKSKIYRSSSAPYLSAKTGRSFRDKDEFDALICSNLFDVSLYSPREWVLENGTDTVCAKKFLNEINYATYY